MLRLIAAICALMLVLTTCSGRGQENAPKPEAVKEESTSKPLEANITKLDLGDHFDTSNVQDMRSMFYNCLAGNDYLHLLH